MININLTATFRLARAAMRGHDAASLRSHHLRSPRWWARPGIPGRCNYTAAKAGMVGMIKSLAQEYAKRGVTANCVAPGFIATPMTDKLNDKQRDAILAPVPAARLGTPAEVSGGRSLSGIGRSVLCDRSDAACERRNGDDLTGIVRSFKHNPSQPQCWSRLANYVNRTTSGWGKGIGGERSRCGLPGPKCCPTAMRPRRDGCRSHCRWNSNAKRRG